MSGTVLRCRFAYLTNNLLGAEYGKKPNLTEASEEHPMVYARFVRYVALRELVRRSSLAIGQSPVVY